MVEEDEDEEGGASGEVVWLSGIRVEEIDELLPGDCFIGLDSGPGFLCFRIRCW